MNDQFNEEALIRDIINRDQKAFSILYDQYAANLNGYLIKVTGNVHLAEDILQECFIKIWNKMELFDRSKGTLFTWMLNICRNSAIDKFRSAAFKRNKATYEIKAVDNRANSESIYKRLDSIGLNSYVKKLSPPFKKIVDLAYYEGLTQQEIAVYLNIPIGTVKTRMRAAIISLRKLGEINLNQNSNAFSAS